jgi:hypothetical protein
MGKWIIFDKWVIASILYVAVLIGGFTVYDEFIADNKQSVSAKKHEGVENHAEKNGSNHEHGSDSEHQGNSEVHTFVQSDKNEIKIFLKDKAGNPVNELEVNHEKLLHLIIVDEHLQKYYHVHPEQTGKGEFRIGNNLPEGFYKAFIDIKPKNLVYHVAPVPFIVGNPSGSTHTHSQELKPDNNFSQNVDGETVKLNMSSVKAKKPVTLTFDLNKTNLTPYLGAMGHVVILDENAQKFLHVHPANDEEPVFETRFEQPGIYKIWAEFKQNGKVRVFPFIVEIKGED